MNRRISATYADATTTFTYDTVGRLVKASDTAPGTGAIDFAYDVLDRLTQEITGQGSVSYQYDVLGRRTNMIANGQQPTTYQYDAASRLTQVAQGSLAVGLGYDNANRRTSLTYPNGTNTSYSYDIASRLTSIAHNGPSGLIEALTYQYDAAGNRTSLTRNNGTASLLPSAVASATYDAANEQTAFAGATLQYDANGNLTNDGVNTYTWDARNRLIGISGGVTASFSYDALGRRTQKTLSTQSSALSTGFLYDGNDIAAEIGGGAVSASYLRSLRVDEPFVRRASTTEYFHGDAQGSTLVLTDVSGGSDSIYTYEPFGNAVTTGTCQNRLQFSSRENDHLGLYFYRARYYSAAKSRFLSEDPIGFGGGDTNTYSFVRNNPANYTDPSGLCFVPGALLGGAIGGISAVAGGFAQNASTVQLAAGFAWGFTTGAIAGCVPYLSFNPFAQSILGAVTNLGDQLLTGALSGRGKININWSGVIGSGIGGYASANFASKAYSLAKGYQADPWVVDFIATWTAIPASGGFSFAGTGIGNLTGF